MFMFALLFISNGPSVADELLGDLENPAVGVRVEALSDSRDRLKKIDVKTPTGVGVFVVDVVPHSPAANAQIGLANILTHVNGKSVRTVDEFKSAVSETAIGKECRIAGYRPIEVRGKVIWKKGTVTITPVSARNVYLGVLRKEVDDVRSTTSYSHLDSPKFVNTQSDLSCYFAATNAGTPTLRLKIQYVADEWLFIRKFTIKADDKTFTLSGEGIERDNGSGNIWEWYNKPVGPSERKLLDAIGSADSVTLRYEGDQYVKDRVLSDEEIARVRHVLLAYQIMGGK